VTDIDARTGLPQPTSGLVGMTHLIYGLHAFSALAGLFGAVFVVTAFLTGWPSIIAVILNYVKRPDVRGTFLESHFRWQIRTFWFAVLCTFVGIPFAWIIAVVVGLWILYRIVRGWLALVSERPLPMPS
jgi:uncharacterized membrane protein